MNPSKRNAEIRQKAEKAEHETGGEWVNKDIFVRSFKDAYIASVSPSVIIPILDENEKMKAKLKDISMFGLEEPNEQAKIALDVLSEIEGST